MAGEGRRMKITKLIVTKNTAGDLYVRGFGGNGEQVFVTESFQDRHVERLAAEWHEALPDAEVRVQYGDTDYVYEWNQE